MVWQTVSVRTPLLVGLVVALAASGLLFFYLRTGQDPYSEDVTIPLTADFVDASGLRPKTRVQINGLDAGRIVQVEHARGADGRPVARVTLRVGKQFEIYQDAKIKKATESLLGDFRLDLDPGSARGRRLQAGERIEGVTSLSDIDEIKEQMVQVARNVNTLTASLTRVLASREGESSLQDILQRVRSAVAGIDRTVGVLEGVVTDHDHTIRSILTHVGQVSEHVASMTAPGGDVPTMAHNLAALTGKLDVMAESLGGFINSEGVGEPGEPGGQASLKSTLENINEALAHINAISRKVDDGTGTVGRVINDPAIADKVEATLDSANGIIGNLATLETIIELRSEYAVPFSSGADAQVQSAIKNTVQLRIQPKPDKYYLFEAIADPRGRQTRTLTTTQLGIDAQGNPTGPSITASQTAISFNDLKFSAQFAKRYFFATMRFGIIENTGGLGVNLHALRDRAELRLDAFDFDRRDPNRALPIFPRLRATGIYQLANHVHVQAGLDDPFTDLRTWFLGGLLRFTDEDLKSLLIVAPKP